MALKFGFFNSSDGDRVYSAEDIGRYLQGIISSGVYADSATSLQVLSSGGMEVQVQAGRAMLHYHFLENTEPLALTLSNGGTLARIDAIVMRLDMERRLCEIAVKEGAPAATPKAPTMLRSDNTKEYMLASVYVNKLVTAITQNDITDTRPDTTVCGWVRGIVKQEATSVPTPSLELVGCIPTVNPAGDGYELLPTDTTLSFDGAPADAGATGRAIASTNAALDAKLGKVLSSDMYGDTLPATGTKGQLFFLAE